jgi:hypothetical protein
MNSRFSACTFVSSLLVCFATLFLCVSVSLAQSGTTGALTGTVTDPSGAVISGATVTATNIGTGQARTETTDVAGSYKFSLLPPGNYKVSFTAAGFKTAEVPSATVNTTETAVLNQALSVGAQSEQITVESTAETIQTQNATNGALVGSREVTDLPLSSRNYTQIIDLSPGVVVNVSSAAALGSGTQDINVNGSGSDQNNYLMDGASITNYGSGGGAQSGNYPGIGIPNPDSIQEFKIQTSQYDAAYGQNPGASVNVITKSGTNQFHGAAWEFVHNNFFDANDFILKSEEGSAGNHPQTFKENQFGGTLGGPIKKDKIFFFGSYQGTRQLNGIGTNGFSTGTTSGVSLPPFNTPCGNRADGCATPIPATLWGPAGTAGNTCGSTGYTYQQYLGCVFGGLTGASSAVTINNSGSNISPVAIALLQQTVTGSGPAVTPFNRSLDGKTAYYVPSGSFVPAGGFGGACIAPCSSSITDPIVANEDQIVANSDYVISSKHTLTEKVFYASDPQIQSFVCLGPCMPGAPENATYTTTDAQLKLTSVLTSNFVNEARISYQREVTNSSDGFNVTACGLGTTPATQIIPMVNNGADCPAVSGALKGLLLVPVIGVTGFPVLNGPAGYGGFNIGGNFFAADTNYFNTYQYADQVSWNHGKHAVRAGFEAQRIQWNWTLEDPGRGDVGFDSLADLLTSQTGVLNSITGNATTRLAPNAPNYHALRVNEFSAFAEDDIKLSRKLTVNLGLRWEYDGFPTDDTGLFTNTWASEAALVNTGSFFLGNEVLNGPGTPSNQVGTLAGFVVQSNYNPNSTICGGPCGFSSPSGATGVYVNSNNTLERGSPIANFAPRIGVAWQPLSDRFVVRAGWGIFYDRIYGNLLGNNQQAVPPYAGAVPLLPTETLNNPFAAGNLGWIPRTLEVAAGSPTTGATVITDNGGGVGLTNNTTSDSQYMGTPLIQEYNLDLQYEFAHNWVADVGYVGQHGTHLYDWARDLNVAHLVPGAPNEPTDPLNAMMVIGAGCSAGGAPSPISHTPCSVPFNDPGNTNPATQVLNNIAASPFGPGNTLGRVQYLGMNPTGLSTTSTIGDDLYDSLQASLRHQFSHGLLLQVAYTWSKLITNVNQSEAGTGIDAPGNVLSGGGGMNDPNNLAQQYGLAAFNRPQRVVISYSYDLPYKHTEGLLGHALGGWTVSGVTTMQDGEPFTVEDAAGGTAYYTFSPFGNGARAELADPGRCNALGVCTSAMPVATPGSTEQRVVNGLAPGVSGWINMAAFGATPCIGGTVAGACATSGGGTGWGNSGVGIISGPGQNNWDISLIKNTKVWESTNLQFRAELYNVWNHAQFNPPGNTLNGFGFGQITKTSVPARIIDFALKFNF